MVKNEQNQSLVELALGRLRDDIVFSIFKPTDKLNIESLKKEKTSLENKYQRENSSVEKYQYKVAQYLRELRNSEQHVNCVSAERDTLKHKFDALTREHEDVKAEVNTVKKQLTEIIECNRHLIQEKREMRNELACAKGNEKKLKEKAS